MKFPDFTGTLYIDPSFKKADALRHQAVIRFDRSGYTIAVTDNANKNVLFAAITDNLPDFDRRAEIIPGKDLQSIFGILPEDIPAIILFSGNKAILVPGNINNKDIAEVATGFNFDLQPGDVVLWSPVESLNATIIYTAAQGALDFSERIFKNSKKNHIGSVIIGNDHRINTGKEATGCSVYLSEGDFFVHVMKQGRSCYFNNFSYKTPEEFVYYMVAIAKTAEIPLSSFPVIISGHAGADNPAITGLKEFCPHVSMSKPATGSGIIPESEFHKFHELIAALS